MDITEAKKTVQKTYSSLKPFVQEIVGKHSKEIDAIVDKIKRNITTLDNREIQNYMLQLSIEVYYFAEKKDSSILMQECAIITSKEAQANVFNETAGTQVVRNNQSIIDTKEQQVVVLLYNAVSNCMKSKLDEAHRMINVLSNVLISRNAENKLKGVAEGGHNISDNSNSEDSEKF